MFKGIENSKITEKISLFTLDIKELTQSDFDILDQYVVRICEGNSDSSSALTKKNLYNFLVTKDLRTQYGAVAEFFVHLLVNWSGLRQEFLFRNLEEGSIKKGFDGCFSDKSEVFLLESKSGSTDTKGISHKSKVREAYNDLRDVISGQSKKSQNNPWRNAYNHASHIDLEPIKGIRKKLKKLSDNYDSGEFHEISNFRVIIASTIFQETPVNPTFHEQSLRDADVHFKKFKAKQALIFCITKATFSNFINYLQTGDS